MKNLVPAIKVGITFIIAIAIGYWSFMMLAKGSCKSKESVQRYYAYFRDATGLVEKSRVQIAGLNVGNIIARELEDRPPRLELVKEKRFAKITIELNKTTVLYSNATIIKRSASLLGEFYLEIDPGTSEWFDAQGKRHVGEVLKGGSEIIFVKEAATSDAIMRQVSDVVPVLKKIAEDIQIFTAGPLQDISKNVSEGINENREAIRAIIANMEAITSDIRHVTAGKNQQIEAIVDDIKSITGGIRSLIGRSDQEVQDTSHKLKSGIDKLNNAIDKLDSVLGNVNDITGDLQEGKGTAGRLLKDNTLIDEVEGVVQDTGNFVRSLTGLQTVVGLRSEYNFLANTIKTYVSIEIRPRPDKYYLIELIQDPRGSRNLTQRYIRSDDPSKPMLTSEEEVEITNTFRFSFQFAKRISLANFRFGIKESTGGVGLDLFLAQDRIRIETDLFDFTANTWPRFKAFGAYEFFRNLYIVGGVDDAFNKRGRDGSGGGRDYFVGAQLRFNDEDLKSLLLFGGGMIGSTTK